MKKISLPWIHLGNVIKQVKIRLCVKLDKIPEKKEEKCFARIFINESNVPLVSPYRFINDNKSLSEGQCLCLNLFADDSSVIAKNDGFLLSNYHVDFLLLLSDIISIEISNLGVIVLQHNLAKIKAVLKKIDNDELGISFIPVTGDGKKISKVKILGKNECLLIDEKLRLYKLDAILTSNEAKAILNSEILPINCFNESYVNDIFEAISFLGIDFSCLKSLSEQSDYEEKILLRIILNNEINFPFFSFRVHLVAQFSFEEENNEIEIPSKGSLPVVFMSSKNNKIIFIKRKIVNEEKARILLFNLGAKASNFNKGFIINAKDSYELLNKIKNSILPKWLYIDYEIMPKIIHLPPVPDFIIYYENDIKSNTLICKLDVNLLDIYNISFEMLEDAVKNECFSFLISSDIIITFDYDLFNCIKILNQNLDFTFLRNQQKIGIAQAYLIVKGLGSKINLVCSDELKERLSLFSGELTKEDLSLPEMLITTLRPYQHDALSWLSQLDRHGIGGLLADDMGLGKTLMILSLFAKIKERLQKKINLVVAPTSVIDVWSQESKKHLKNLNVFIWHGSKRFNSLSLAKNSDILITSYAILRNDVDYLNENFTFCYLVMDEAQNLKNSSTETWRSARKIISEQKIALSGTPIENSIYDLWSIIEIIAPKALGSEKFFQKNYANKIHKGDIEKIEDLKKHIRPIVLRRKKGIVEKDLPEKIENIIRCKMEPDQYEFYLNVISSIEKKFKSPVTGNHANQKQISLLAALTRLRQVCCDPRLVPITNKNVISSAKSKLLIEIVNECLLMGRRIIIYSQFVRMQEYIHIFLNEIGIKDSLWLHGRSKNRSEIISKFQDPNGPKIIVVSLKAGGTGITLTAADTVIFYDPWWNPAVEDQATDRAHRIGQKKTVHVIKLICRDSIEEKILNLSYSKKRVANSILTIDGLKKGSISLGDIKNLLISEFNRNKK